jgi:phage terminase large subunit-like protein
MREKGVSVTRGRMGDNAAHLAPAFIEAMTALHSGTRLGRQELDGELIEDVEGALWSRTLIEASRTPLDFARDERKMVRVVVGVDPPASASGDACGIVVCGVDAEGVSPSTSLGTGYVLGDHSVRGLSPEGWAGAVAAAAEAWGADLVVAETNQGGEMVESVLRTIDAALPVRPVKARFGKGQRAEPVAILFERGKAKFAGTFPELEDELAGMQRGGGYEGPGRSPDRADAMVWALTELMLGKEKAEPRVVVL